MGMEREKTAKARLSLLLKQACSRRLDDTVPLLVCDDGPESRRQGKRESARRDPSRKRLECQECLSLLLARDDLGQTIVVISGESSLAHHIAPTNSFLSSLPPPWKVQHSCIEDQGLTARGGKIEAVAQTRDDMTSQHACPLSSRTVGLLRCATKRPALCIPT
jgi:hypothetical protein